MKPAATLGVMNSSVDRDARTVRIMARRPRIAEHRPPLLSPRLLPAPAATGPQAGRGRAQAQARPASAVGTALLEAALSRQVDALRYENARLAAQVAESRKLTPMLGMRRQRFTLGWAASSGPRWRHLTRLRTRQRCGGAARPRRSDRGASRSASQDHDAPGPGTDQRTWRSVSVGHDKRPGRRMTGQAAAWPVIASGRGSAAAQRAALTSFSLCLALSVAARQPSPMLAWAIS